MTEDTIFSKNNQKNLAEFVNKYKNIIWKIKNDGVKNILELFDSNNNDFEKLKNNFLSLEKDSQEKILQKYYHFLEIKNKKLEKQIEESKKAEEKSSILKALFKNLPANIYIKDLQGKYLDFGSYMWAYLWWIKKSKIIWKTYWEIFWDEDKNTKEIQEEDKIIQEKRTLIKTWKDNRTGKWLYTAKIPIYDKNWDVTLIMWIDFDITQWENSKKELITTNEELLSMNEEAYAMNETLKNTNAKLEDAKQKAEESNRLKTAFLQNISHEIRTPMNHILGFVQIINENLKEIQEKRQSLNSEDVLSEIKNYKSYMSYVTNSWNNLLNIIDNIIDISQIISWTVNINKNTFDLNEIVSDIKTNFITKAEEKNLKLKVENNFINSSFYWDKNKILQIINNLINNAIKFTDQWEINIKIKEVDNNIKFEVKDTWTGIPENIKPKIMKEHFIKWDNRKSNDTWTGIWLSICSELVKLMWWEIEFESEEWKWTTFWVSLPIEKN